MTKLKFNIASTDRKNLAKALGQILGWQVFYLRAPSFEYKVHDYTITKDSEVICPESITKEELEALIRNLAAEGFTNPEVIDDSTNAASTQELTDDLLNVHPNEAARPIRITTGASGERYIIMLRKEDFEPDELERIQMIIDSKASVLREAFDMRDLGLFEDDENLIWDWFKNNGDNEELGAYTSFVASIAKMARDQKHITAKDEDSHNNKYRMRMFLIRLGFNGKDKKNYRKILLKNLSGNSAWKNGEPAKQNNTAPQLPEVEIINSEETN